MKHKPGTYHINCENHPRRLATHVGTLDIRIDYSTLSASGNKHKLPVLFPYCDKCAEIIRNAEEKQFCVLYSIEQIEL